MTENIQRTPALASEERGRWIPDPGDPEFEVWEAVDSEAVESAPKAEEDPSKKVVVWSDGRGPRRPCQARRSNGEPCQRAAVSGADVCGTHGGRAPQVKRKARLRLEMAADKLAQELINVALDDPDIPPAVKLAALRDALSRAGISEKSAVEVSVDAKPFEEVLGAIMSGGSRAASRAARGLADTDDADAAWIAEELAASNVIDVEVEDPAPRPRPSEEPATPKPRDTGLMDMETALAQLRATTPPPAPTGKRRGRTR
ncbi:hypothetical protein [Tsukamurella strandjordii]|uniref:Uncharacterized protein n=1 Tax=Tsukamurella strandjordii TaxID=147577 RepID=A0AA90S9P3_9ACTN|nr:hypothetical protein [Tsukamurella strandjordii]MDP0400385.1 hypothetical protein [Tsukamurella strandjordii]